VDKINYKLKNGILAKRAAMACAGSTKALAIIQIKAKNAALAG
jgi:hypothetical protein